MKPFRKLVKKNGKGAAVVLYETVQSRKDEDTSSEFDKFMIETYNRSRFGKTTVLVINS